MSSLSTELVFFLGGDAADATEAVVTVDHVQTGLSRLRLQFRSANQMDDVAGRTNMEKFLAALLAPLNDVEFALQQLLQLRGLPTATGIRLDDIGGILNQPRGELADEDYRRYLFARVATNKSSGARETLIKIAKLIIDDDSTRVVVETVGPAAVVVRIEGVLILDALAAILLSFLSEAPGAGIRLTLESSPELLEDQFAFPLAAFATAGGYTIGQTTITVDSTAGFPVTGTLIIDEGVAVEESVDYAGLTSTTFSLLDPLANNHTIRTTVTLDEPSTGDGFGDEAEGEALVPYVTVGSTGGMLIDARESTSV